MQLLVDLGNTRLKWALSDETQLLQVGQPLVVKPASFAADLEVLWAGLPTPDRIRVSNVAGDEWSSRLNRWTRDQWKRTPEWVRPQAQALGVTNAYQNPCQLGVDRWVALIATRHMGLLPACVVDCGTAVTIDVLDTGGVHQGGLIVPGVRAMQTTLAQTTDAIEPVTRRHGSVRLLADNTAEAVYNGALQAVVGAIGRVSGYAQRRFGMGLTIVLTGGDAETVAVSLDLPVTRVPDLVLRGLAVMGDAR